MYEGISDRRYDYLDDGAILPGSLPRNRDYRNPGGTVGGVGSLRNDLAGR